jgi:hypothetical protein
VFSCALEEPVRWPLFADCDAGEIEAGNKGFDAAMTAIEMVNLMQKLPK